LYVARIFAFVFSLGCHCCTISYGNFGVIDLSPDVFEGLEQGLPSYDEVLAKKEDLITNP